MKGDDLGLDFALFDVDFVAAEDDGDVFADTDEVTWEIVSSGVLKSEAEMLTVPVGDVLIGDARCDVEHDDTALAVDVITVSQPTELFLPCCVPDIELDLTEVLLDIRSS